MIRRTHEKTGRVEDVPVKQTPFGPRFETVEQYAAAMNAMVPKFWHYEPIKKGERL